MSIFPTDRTTRRQSPVMVHRDLRLEGDGALVQPIKGHIYLIEEEDLKAPIDGKTSPPSGLVSRH